LVGKGRREKREERREKREERREKREERRDRCLKNVDFFHMYQKSISLTNKKRLAMRAFFCIE
jgi:hypothetical protein